MKTQDIDRKKSYIYFSIGKENFAIDVSKVLEIMHLEQITVVPNASDYIRGILNFRGVIVPIINLAKRFNFPQQEDRNDMIIVVEIYHNEKIILMGLLVNEVNDVIEFEFKDIQSVPDIGIKYNPEFIEGFIELNGKFIMVLNVEKVLSPLELAEVSESASSVSI
jgi:purine-binding chemotaxis protein CheW